MLARTTHKNNEVIVGTVKEFQNRGIIEGSVTGMRSLQFVCITKDGRVYEISGPVAQKLITNRIEFIK